MTSPGRSFVICVDADGYPASLVSRRVYEERLDAEAESKGLIRVIDESGEDYLYPEHLFVRLELPEEAARAFA